MSSTCIVKADSEVSVLSESEGSESENVGAMMALVLHAKLMAAARALEIENDGDGVGDHDPDWKDVDGRTGATMSLSLEEWILHCRDDGDGRESTVGRGPSPLEAPAPSKPISF